MTGKQSHQGLVGSQFGATAASYLTSAVHAQGADLKMLADLVAGLDKPRVLDLGCGAGHVSFNVSPHASEVVAYDLSSEMLGVVAKAASDRGLANISTRQGVVERLPFEDGSFDCVLTRFSAHHWLDFEAALREAARVVKPGGTVGFTDTVTPGSPLLDTHLQTIELLRDPSHVRNYTRSQWDAAIGRAGLSLGLVTPFTLRIEFASWVARMRTPQVLVDAIRALQATWPDKVEKHFALGADGSFDLEAACFQGTKPAA